MVPSQELLAIDSLAFVVYTELGHFSTPAMHKVQKEVVLSKNKIMKNIQITVKENFSLQGMRYLRNVPSQTYSTYKALCQGMPSLA